MRALICALALAVAACASQPAFDPAVPLVLTGEITRADHQTYREIPFIVPAGVKRIMVEFSYTGKDQKTVIDLGLRDPQGQRGWSGGNKSRFEIGETSATPSYRPGPIQPGEWKLVLGIPNIRDGQTASYTATVSFSANENVATTTTAFSPVVLSTEPGWRRGDFHVHTAHSDGSCDVAGTRAPCPAMRTFDAARDAGLDFVAITDHNTLTQLADIAASQKQYPKTLLIPGTEVTTFNGHANAVGLSQFVDFQLGSPRLPTLAKLFDEADTQGAFVSVNHPSLPSGEVCMGCGWTVKDTDWSRVAAIEVVNGSTLRTSGAESGLSGIAFWDKLLKEGHRITAIGGSDNHDATDVTGAKQSPIGKPATVVYASELSTKGIVDGVKSGRVFVDVVGLPGVDLEMRTLVSKVHMGGVSTFQDGDSQTINVSFDNAPADARLTLIWDGIAVEDVTRIQPTSSNPDLQFFFVKVQAKPGAAHGYIRPEIRDASGKLLLLGNPIYFVRAGDP